MTPEEIRKLDDYMNNKNQIEDKICKCACHVQGAMVMHCFPCCDYCDRKYLDEKGKIVPEKLPQELLKIYEED